MSFSLFECRDGTFVVVPRGLTPPIEAYNAHGEFRHVSDHCRHLYDSPVWDDVSRVIDHMLYAAVRPEVASCIFELPGCVRPRSEGAAA